MSNRYEICDYHKAGAKVRKYTIILRLLLQLVHANVVDTSVVFPHKLGLPFKRALRTLTSEFLQRIIQEDGMYDF